MSLDEFYFSFVFCGIWKQQKLNKKTPSEQVEIKKISKPPSFHFCFAHRGGITYLQYSTVVG